MGWDIPDFYYVIYGASFLTAIISAVAGMMGGTFLLAVLAQYLRMEELIPVHGLIQLWSNATRAYFIRHGILWNIVRDAAIGVLLGGFLGRYLVVSIPQSTFNLTLGIFILLITFIPKIPLNIPFPGRWVIFGFIAIMMGLFFGAVGTFVGAVLLAQKFSRDEIVATQAMSQTLIHTVKVVVFMWIGFQISKWFDLLVVTWILTFAGSWIGTKLLTKIPEQKFKLILKIIISILALRLIFVR